MKNIKFYFSSARPKQWIKNLLVFAAPFFAYKFNSEIFLNSLKAFIIFSTISSAIYFLNDAIDFEKDRLHPKKKLRPIAQGLISRKAAIKLSFVLLIFGNLYAFYASYFFAILVTTYCLIQIAYCNFLKEKPILDIYCISSGFILRALAGGAISDIYLSPWFILTIGLMALFLAIEKRKAELRFYIETGIVIKKVLKIYSLPLLIRLENIVSASSFITYSLWASGPTLNGAKTSWMLLTIPFILYGIFRYQMLSDPKEWSIESFNFKKSISTESPEEVLFNDRVLQINIIAWLLSVLIIFKFTG